MKYVLLFHKDELIDVPSNDVYPALAFEVESKFITFSNDRVIKWGKNLVRLWEFDYVIKLNKLEFLIDDEATRKYKKNNQSTRTPRR